MTERQEATKLAFVGTSSVGKTTLLEYYRKNYAGIPDVVFVEEAARTYFSRYPSMPVSQRFAEHAQGQVQDLAIEAEQLAHNSGARLIFCDRSVLDAVAYVRSTGDRKGADKLLRKVEGWIPTYTELFLLDPVGIPFANDEVRQEDHDTRQRFHEAFIDLFESEGIVYELLSGTQRSRIQRVDQVIKSSGIIYEK